MGARANMAAMWRVGRLIATPLAFIGVVVCPPAWASPEGESPLPYGQSPVWGTCERFVGDTGGIPEAQCGTIAVPVDYANPQGAQAQLAVIRVPATGERLGVLMVNPGGPGASAVDTVASMGAALADTGIRRRFDLVGFDPRGVGHSAPEVRCRTDAEFDVFRREPLADYSPAGVAHIEDLYRRFAKACLDRMGPEFLANVGTATAVRDMDVVRSALGEHQINYLGFSYGTDLGATYAERFPDRVRTMVLDGAVDPTLDPTQKLIRQMAGFQRAFEDYAADCAQSEGCPLGTDPAKFGNRYRQLVDPLVARPGFTSDPRGLSYQDAIIGTGNALYSQRLWKFLTSGLLGLARAAPTPVTCCCSPTSITIATRLATTRMCRMRPWQSAASTRSIQPTRRCGPTPIARSAKSRRSSAMAPSPASHRVMSARSGRCRRRPRRTRQPRRVPARWSWCPPPATRPRRTRPGWTWPARWARR
jgi:pimeloyl-ACP methyl ester carboxylesterase